MSSHTFGAFIEHNSVSSKDVAGPANVLHRDEVVPKKPSVVELDELKWGQQLNGPGEQQIIASSLENAVNPTPKALEESRPSSPAQDNAANAIVQSATNPPRNRWRLASTGLMFLLIGINDAVVCEALQSWW